ncbi:MAG: DUF1573 domain-containing protein [Tissierellia bacterium]|nr:DUF1573 domain-containing protein [Tissierellia bacterium]
MNASNVYVQKDLDCDTFQNQVDEALIRHKSVLDIMTKLDEYNSRINRAVAKSVTSCGCIKINATKQDFNKDSLEEIRNNMKDHIEGELCAVCEEILQEEMGAYLFYLAALCNALDISLSEAVIREYSNIKALGVFSLK